MVISFKEASAPDPEVLKKLALLEVKLDAKLKELFGDQSVSPQYINRDFFGKIGGNHLQHLFDKYRDKGWIITYDPSPRNESGYIFQGKN